MRSGAGASSRPRWKYAAVMGFLAPFVEGRETSSNLLRRSASATSTHPSILPPTDPSSLQPTDLSSLQPTDLSSLPPTNPPSPTLSLFSTQEELHPPSSSNTGPMPEPPTSTPQHNPDPGEGCSGPRYRKRRRDSMSVFERQLIESLRTQTPPPPPPPPPQVALRTTDEDELFFLSLLPTLKRLPPAKKSAVKFQIYKFLFEAEQESSQ